MGADISRSTFDPDLACRSVLMQQGRVLLDADWNEQTRIAAHHDEVRANDIIGVEGGQASPDGPGPFAIVTLDDAQPPAGVSWDKLAITPGRYYIDGVLAEALPQPSHPGGVWPMANQQYLRSIGAPSDLSPGLPEPAAGEGDRWAVYLDVFDHLVTADERPELLESALGGPDTSTREQTVWQVRLAPIGANDTCADIGDVGRRTPRAMAATHKPAAIAASPCEITARGGYTRLENQLYRVEIFDIDQPVGPRFVWSRENGSVVARLVAIEGDVLSLDRTGCDEELSILPGDLIEVTSTDRELRHQPGFLATVTDHAGTELRVSWAGIARSDLPSLGRAPIVRRWEGGPEPLTGDWQALEDGLQVRFSTSGAAAVGDYWMIPARTTQLSYGIASRVGTIDWPWDVDKAEPASRPPHGPRHHTAPLGILEREASRWSVNHDCRTLFLPLTQLARKRTLSLLGGDGQQPSRQGATVPQPIRVLVDSPLGPVKGAIVRAQATSTALVSNWDGSTPSMLAGTGASDHVTAPTDELGVAAFVWQPSFDMRSGGSSSSDVLSLGLEGEASAAVVVSAHPGVAMPKPPAHGGVRITSVELITPSRELGSPVQLENDTNVSRSALADGIRVVLSGPVRCASFVGKPVSHLWMDFPHQISKGLGLVTYRAELSGVLRVGPPQDNGGLLWPDDRERLQELEETDVLIWESTGPNLDEHLDGLVGAALSVMRIANRRIEEVSLRMWFQIIAQSIIDADGNCINGRAIAVIAEDGHTHLSLPTIDEPPGGPLETWFYLIASG